ncbi:hypothetical protein ACQPYE_17055 [Actinosynnema sp. CA-299493]
MLPRQAMSPNSTPWFIDLAGHRDGVGTYARDELVSSGDAAGQVTAHRAAGTTRADTLSGGERTPAHCR